MARVDQAVPELMVMSEDQVEQVDQVVQVVLVLTAVTVVMEVQVDQAPLEVRGA